MATRSTVNISYYGRTYAKLYIHYDGYIEGVGHDLVNVLSSYKVIHGIGAETEGVANGCDCLAAFMIKDLKKKVGNVYMLPFDSEGLEEYNYYVVLKDDGDHIVLVKDYEGKIIFRGGYRDLLNFKEDENEVEGESDFNENESNGEE